MDKNIPKFEYGFYSDCLKETYKKFGEILSLPIIKDPYSEVKNNYITGNVLDIGAGKDKSLERHLKLKNGKYYSLDNDPCGVFDFKHIDEIPENLRFSMIIANQVFEHLDIQESIEMMVKASSHLEKNGKFIATVPNISHPNRQISNITHKTAWGYNSFYMLFKYANLDVIKIARYSKRYPEGIIEKLITKYVSRVFRMDWCDSIILIGANNG